ncbi:MAG TPA: TraR/DksA C4-type zinc finger protein [Phycisphaerae bacterium]|nr:TraR/DksA C4-type zinc finger protein [Phycisphaerae bacterium]
MNRRNEPQKKKKISSPQKRRPARSNGTNLVNGPVTARTQRRIDGSGTGGHAEPPAAMPASKLPPTDIEVFRQMLLQIRRQLLGDVDHMETEALNTSRSDASGDLSLMPIHMADIGTDNYEREFTIGLIENETETVKEIDAALDRIEKGTYGMCEATRKPIGKARLKVKPWARYCVAYERSRESNRQRRR